MNRQRNEVTDTSSWKRTQAIWFCFVFYRESMVLADFYEMDIKLQER